MAKNEEPTQWDPTPAVDTPSMTYDFLTLGAEPTSFETRTPKNK